MTIEERNKTSTLPLKSLATTTCYHRRLYRWLSVHRMRGGGGVASWRMESSDVVHGSTDWSHRSLETTSKSTRITFSIGLVSFTTDFRDPCILNVVRHSTISFYLTIRINDSALAISQCLWEKFNSIFHHYFFNFFLNIWENARFLKKNYCLNRKNWFVFLFWLWYAHVFHDEDTIELEKD